MYVLFIFYLSAASHGLAVYEMFPTLAACEARKGELLNKAVVAAAIERAANKTTAKSSDYPILHCSHDLNGALADAS